MTTVVPVARSRLGLPGLGKNTGQPNHCIKANNRNAHPSMSYGEQQIVVTFFQGENRDIR